MITFDETAHCAYSSKMSTTGKAHVLTSNKKMQNAKEKAREVEERQLKEEELKCKQEQKV